MNDKENIEEEARLMPEIILVVIGSEGKMARPRYNWDGSKKYRIQEVMMGAGLHRKAVPWTDGFLKEHTECSAEILENGKLRII